MAKRRSINSFSGGIGTHIVIVAMLFGAVALFVVGRTTDALQWAYSGSDDSAESSSTSTTELAPEVAAFTSAKTGSCLTWEMEQDQTINDFRIVDCAEPHIYEVASVLDMRTASQMEVAPELQARFSENNEYPTQEELVGLRDTVCHVEVQEYLGGQYDATGKFASAPIIPPRSAWDQGDRTLLCGAQAVGPGGVPVKIEGHAREQDQSRLYEPGACVSITEDARLRVVECAEPHAMESVGFIDVRAELGDNAADAQAQNDLLAARCTDAAIAYLGDEETLYQSTLVPFWTVLSPESLAGGSNSTNCWLIKDNGAGGFSTLQGHAGQDLLIDGVPPAAPPRNPIRGQ